jgi:hypothetical protein
MAALGFVAMANFTICLRSSERTQKSYGAIEKVNNALDGPILPDIRMSQNVSLHVYSPKTSKIMRSFEKLAFLWAATGLLQDSYNLWKVLSSYG